MDVVLLDMFDGDDDALVQADVGKDLTGASSYAGHRATLRRLGRVVDRSIHDGVLRVSRARIDAALRSAGAASQ